MGREYFHWIDLRLISLMEAVIFKIYLTKIGFWSKPTFLTANKGPKRYKQVKRPKPIFLCHSAAECGSSIEMLILVRVFEGRFTNSLF